MINKIITLLIICFVSMGMVGATQTNDKCNKCNCEPTQKQVDIAVAKYLDCHWNQLVNEITCKIQKWMLCHIDLFKGKDGLNGTNGYNGLDGINGTNGLNGTNGIDGINGTNGLDGINGTNGINGINGTDGNTTNLIKDVPMEKTGIGGILLLLAIIGIIVGVGVSQYKQ